MTQSLFIAVFDTAVLFVADVLVVIVVIILWHCDSRDHRHHITATVLRHTNQSINRNLI